MNTHKSIKIIGARENNLKNINLEIKSYKSGEAFKKLIVDR